MIVDLYPRDAESGCYADMTRAFCIGEAPGELVRYHGPVREALDLAYEIDPTGRSRRRAPPARLRALPRAWFPNATLGRSPAKSWRMGSSTASATGWASRCTRPGLGRNGEELLAGDVLAVEPGLYRTGFGGCRLEDLVLVTEDGCDSSPTIPTT